MPNTSHTISLEIKPSQTPGYEFSGGNGPNPGDVVNTAGQGAAPVVITLKPLSGYSIRAMNDTPPGVQLTGTGTAQMGASVSGASARIDNACSGAANVDYTVNVRAPDGSNIACHPKIVNN